MGIRTIGNLLSGSSRFSYGLDDFRVYNRTLLDSEVVALYGNGDGDFGTHRYEEFPPVFDNVPVILLPKDAVLHWTFDNLDGNTITDISGYQNEGIADTNDSEFDLFLNNSTLGKKRKALKFAEDLTIRATLEESEDTYSLKNSFSISFWLNAEKSDASVISSGRINLSLNDSYLTSSIYVGSRWRNTEPFLIPLGSWVHVVLWWDGNKLRII